MTPRVVMVSDCTDVAAAELYLAVDRAVRETDPSVSVQIGPLVPVRPYSILHTAFLTRLLAESAAPGTVLMVVVNSRPERTERLVGRTGHGDLFFAGANTGALGWLTADLGVRECYELTDPGFVPFGGKFVHAPAVGALAAGTPLARLGLPFPADRIRRLLPQEGTVVHVDNFGNAKFPLAAGALRFGDRLRVRIGGHVLDAVYWERMMDLADGTWVVYPGSSLGLHELGQVRSAGLHGLGCAVGDRVRVDVSRPCSGAPPGTSSP
ncbi:SAM-dependent chlorinase/fluorinase [Streptomyces sp. NPDC046870]|uniref:SAM-dependent chlorinase/fluorinase n=1 Tax=Streptomyces sp. NPDC046870 TaxID=3155135 RepID=UPI0034521E94